MNKLILITVVLSVALVSSCGRSRRGDAASDAQKQSELAANQEQARLWKEGNKNGLNHIPRPEQPVQVRQRSVINDVAVQSKPAPLPQGVPGGVSIISLPQLPETDGRTFASEVRVRRVEGEQIELDLGGQGTLAFFARARGGPLRASTGDVAQLDLRLREDPFNRQQIMALRLANSDGIISALDMSDKPVTISIPLFKLIATQTGTSEKHLMNVTITVGGERKVMSAGQVQDFADAGLTVGVIGSDAFTGDMVNTIEGRPYALHIIAWPTK